MDINNSYLYAVHLDENFKPDSRAGSTIEKDVKELVKKTMNYIEMEYPWYFTEDAERRDIAFVTGGKGYYSYFSTISKKLSVDEFKTEFEKKLTKFFKEAVTFVDDDVRSGVLARGGHYGARECAWNLCLPGNDGEIIIEFNSQDDQSDIPWHTLNVVAEEAEK